MLTAMLFYLGSVIFTWALGIFLLWKVEKSGVKRWGATGRLFTYK